MARGRACAFRWASASDSGGSEPITLTELASFAPAVPSLQNDPTGFGVVGLPTNFYAPAETQTFDVVLRGRPVTVTFTPVSFVFDTGDGTVFTTDSGGTAWTAAGEAQFTRTPTSHTYRARGTYAATVTIHYSATVTIGTYVIPIDGTIPITSAPSSIQVVEVRTALVDKTCDENPGGPGC